MQTTLNQPSSQILLALGRYGYLTSRQVTDLLFSQSSQSYSQENLKRLVVLGYAEKDEIPAKGVGNSPGIWRLSRQGRRMLHGNGVEFLVPAEGDKGLYFYEHMSAVNDVLIAAERLERQEVFTILSREHDLQLKRQPVSVELTSGRKVRVIPDAWLTLDVGGPNPHMGIAFEIDRGTASERRFREKIEALVAFADGPSRERFAIESLTIAVVTTEGEKRAALLRRWIGLELSRLKRAHWNEVFLVTHVTAASTDPLTFYCGTHWRSPLSEMTRPLVEGVVL